MLWLYLVISGEKFALARPAITNWPPLKGPGVILIANIDTIIDIKMKNQTGTIWNLRQKKEIINCTFVITKVRTSSVDTRGKYISQIPSKIQCSQWKGNLPIDSRMMKWGYRIKPPEGLITVTFLNLNQVVYIFYRASQTILSRLWKRTYKVVDSQGTY